MLQKSKFLFLASPWLLLYMNFFDCNNTIADSPLGTVTCISRSLILDTTSVSVSLRMLLVQLLTVTHLFLYLWLFPYISTGVYPSQISPVRIRPSKSISSHHRSAHQIRGLSLPLYPKFLQPTYPSKGLLQYLLRRLGKLSGFHRRTCRMRIASR